MRNIFSFPTLILLIFSYTSVKMPLKAQEVNEDGQTINLFNGTDLDGWYTFIQNRGRNTDPRAVFRVQDGMIRISGEEWGCITSLKEYENYRLIAEFKWGEQSYEPRLNKARDSGILLHSQGKDGSSQGIWIQQSRETLMYLIPKAMQ